MSRSLITQIIFKPSNQVHHEIRNKVNEFDYEKVDLHVLEKVRDQVNIPHKRIRDKIKIYFWHKSCMEQDKAILLQRSLQTKKEHMITHGIKLMVKSLKKVFKL